MNWEAIGAIAEIAGILILIVSVVYLAIQVRDSNRIAQAQSVQSVLDAQRDRSIIPWIVNPEIGDVFAAGHQSLESLSATDKRRFYLTLTEMVFHLQNVMQLYDKGLITGEEYQTFLSFTATLITTPGGSKAWGYMKTQMTPSVVRLLEAYVEENPDAPTVLDLNPLFRSAE